MKSTRGWLRPSDSVASFCPKCHGQKHAPKQSGRILLASLQRNHKNEPERESTSKKHAKTFALGLDHLRDSPHSRANRPALGCGCGSKPMGPHFGVGTNFRTNFSWDWDVHSMYNFDPRRESWLNPRLHLGRPQGMLDRQHLRVGGRAPLALRRLVVHEEKPTESAENSRALAEPTKGGFALVICVCLCVCFFVCLFVYLLACWLACLFVCLLV